MFINSMFKSWYPNFIIKSEMLLDTKYGHINGSGPVRIILDTQLFLWAEKLSTMLKSWLIPETDSSVFKKNLWLGLSWNILV